MRHVDVVIPVYDGYRETVACLTSVLQPVGDDWARIGVIDDCTPNQQIIEYLRKLDLQYPQLLEPR